MASGILTGNCGYSIAEEAGGDGINPHDRIEMAAGAKVTRLPGDILHYSYYTFSEHIAQLNKFTSIQAQAMYEQGKKASLIKLLISPVAAFYFRLYFKTWFPGWVGWIDDRKNRFLSNFCQICQVARIAATE